MNPDTHDTPPLRRRWRRPLLIGGPLTAAVIAAVIAIVGGRYVATDDAYVKSNMVNISAELAGPVARVLVAENQPVSRGQALLQLDPRSFELAVRQADAALRQTRLQIESLRASHGQKTASLDSARNDLAYRQQQAERSRRLFAQHVLSRSALDTAEHDLDVARSRVTELEHDLSEVLAKLGGDAASPIDQHPSVLAAQTALDKARLDLDRTTVRASIDGVASKVPEPGTYAMPGLPLLSVVASRDTWVEANFKESELERLRAGQPVSIRIDAYPHHAWAGEVTSIGQATGAEFSLLPPQNASGNWVKVVQRIPVRVHIRHADDEPPLRTGMSAEISVDTGRRPVTSRFLAWLGVGNANAATP